MFPKGILQFMLILIISLITCSPLIYILNMFLENQNLIMGLFYMLFLSVFIGLIHLINYNRGKIISYKIKPLSISFLFFSILIVWLLQTAVFLPLRYYIYPHKVFNSDVYFLLGALLIGPILEEIVFRNILLNSLLNTHTKKIAIIISSLIFAVIHGNPFQIMIAFILGLFFGVVYSKNRNILHTIILHCFANIFGVLGQYYALKFSKDSFFMLLICLNVLVSFLFLYYLNLNSSNKYGYSMLDRIKKSLKD